MTSQEGGAPPLGRLPWLVLLALLVHVLEEWPSFPEWATLHFGTTSLRFYVASHIPILGIVAWLMHRATRPGAGSRSVWCVGMVLTALLANAFFHGGASFVFREVSPGVVSASFLYVPLSMYMWPRIASILGRRGSVEAFAVGLLVSVVVTSSLAVDMPTL